MSDFTLGIYWKEQPLTLRQYGDLMKKYLTLLKKLHPAFRSLRCLNRRAENDAVVDANLENLDSLIYECSWDDELIYKNPNQQGGPSWDSLATIGYGMYFDSAEFEDQISTSVFAGVDDKSISNFATINFPGPGKNHSRCVEFHDYDFIKRLFIAVIQCWAPNDGLVFSHDFSAAVKPKTLPCIGWLTYLHDPRAAALHNDIRFKDLLFEEVEGGGTLITLDRKIIDAGNDQQVANARILRDTLIAQQLINV